MTCHIRGKFRGRGKRDNTLISGTWVLVGLREWEHEASGDKLLNCDLIEVYSDSDKVRLKNSITSVDWSRFITNDTKSIGALVNDITNDITNDIEFADDKTQEYKELIEAHLAAGKSTIITTDDGKEVDVDDI